MFECSDQDQSRAYQSRAYQSRAFQNRDRQGAVPATIMTMETTNLQPTF
jgi:hypothetical protein